MQLLNLPPLVGAGFGGIRVEVERPKNDAVEACFSRPDHHQPEQDQDVEWFVRENKIVEAVQLLTGDCYDASRVRSPRNIKPPPTSSVYAESAAFI